MLFAGANLAIIVFTLQSLGLLVFAIPVRVPVRIRFVRQGNPIF